eukprot:TRINITY_DN1303_c0_g1_i1.p2 TRINITY_DN1303_c0_g1~~TRINITY_DN1303_c0_g1_i1.p2  ORF type:complete len:208 (+),score=27.62 TRINITY_DN1303_c0_g1_i1:146-769(+)
MAMDSISGENKFLDQLISGVQVISEQNEINTLDFTKAVSVILPAFNYLGTVFAFAKSEMEGKNKSLVDASGKFPKLKDILAEDKKNGTITTKNSPSRNLHRLMSAILFVKLLLDKLLEHNYTMYDAASEAYEAALAPIHTVIVKGTVRTGLLVLPSTDDFLAQIGETRNTAASKAAIFIESADKVCKQIDDLYEEPMPPSTAWFIST